MLVSEIKPYAKNAKKHDKKQIEQVAKSIKEFGFNQPLVVDKQGVLIVGHGRLEAAKLLKLEEVPTIVVDLTEEQANAYRLADNKLNESEWDMKLVIEELKGLSHTMIDLTGFDKDLILEAEDKDDETPEVPKEPISKLGDLYQLGGHRILCGDSTKIEDVNLLIDGQNIDLVYTDPPYGINEKGDRSKRCGLAQGNNLPDFKDDTNQYAIDAYNICETLKIPRQVWWGANYYCHALPLSNNWFVWDKRVEEKQSNTQSDCELAWVKSKWSSVRIFRHLWKGMMKDSERGEKRVHATQKPVALAKWAFDYFKEVNTVLDLFTGSGSTLIACEKDGKNFFGMEFEPKYCDVIVERWCEFTGNRTIIKNGLEIVWHMQEEDQR